MPRSAVLGLVLLAVLPLLGEARGADGQADAPRPAEQRYQEAQKLTQERRYPEAAAAYLGVADDDAAPATLRAQALFAAALMQQNARDYERAAQLYADVQRRFPDTDFAVRARGAAAAMTQGSRWLEFRRRHDAAWDELSPGKEIAERDGPRAAREHLERAATLLAALLHDFGEEPQARDVAMALGDAHMLLYRFDLAGADYARAVELSRGDPGAVNSPLAEAEQHLREAHLSLRRQRITRGAMALFIVVALGLLALRPWRAVDPPTLRLAGSLVVVTLLLSIAAMISSWVIVRYIDDHSPVGTTAAALLVALPGITGVVFALGYRGGLRRTSFGEGRWATGLAAFFGAVAALCIAIAVIQSFELFPVLDSML